MDKISVIVKAPGEKTGHMETIDNTLRALQELAGGPIEILYIDRGALMVINEEGHLRGLDINFRTPLHTIVGTAVITGTRGEELADCPMDLQEWKEMLRRWGNTP